MESQVGVMDPEGRKTAEFAGVPDGCSPSGRSAKFVYSSGSRPLAGYTIKRGVGQGGFGEIYYAISDAGKEVALKLVRRNLEVELRGIRHCLNLRHPNLLDLYDIRQDDQGDTWVVMEFVSGECLEDALRRHPNGMPMDAALAWFHGIADAVAYLHDHGIVHRDLKPGNVFSGEGVVKVGDYGLSKFISCSRRSGHTESIGTVHYMAPEVANGRYGKEIDVYALGIVLYELLTGRVPFDGESVGEVLMKHLTALPDLAPLGEPYRSVVGRALEKDPQKRFPSVNAMLAALPVPERVRPGAGRLPSGTYSTYPAGGAAAPDSMASDGLASDEEPIWRAIRDSTAKAYNVWQNANLGLPVRVVLILLGLGVLLANFSLLVPILIGFLALYGAYRLVRSLVLAALPPGSSGLAGSGGLAGRAGLAGREGGATYRPQPHDQRHDGRRDQPATRQTGRRLWHRTSEEAVAALVIKPARQRLADLLASMLGSTLVVAVTCLVLSLLHGYHAEGMQLEQAAWLFLVGLVGTWAVLVPSKLWEGTEGEPILRRFTMMVLGLGVGLFAFCAGQFLWVSLPPAAGFPPPPAYQLPAGFYAADGRPLITAYLAVFGTLFLVVRWWRQADPLRPARLRFWSVILCVVLAGFVAGLWRFPQVWLPMAAAVMTISIQLSSPWINRHERRCKLETRGS
ncbi:MAG: serine/threonine-protein kinase [Patescibacteria group bacterium]|nr:serine/threonine-protein kinase [Patescibacteria group bacterium]